MALSMKRVVGLYQDTDLTDTLVAASGYVRFRLPTPLVDTAGNSSISIKQSVRDVTLDANGALDIYLPATDDATTNPSGLTIWVEEHINGRAVNPYRIEIAHDAVEPIQLADLVPATSTSYTTYASAVTFNAHVTANANVHGIADTSALETTSGAQSKADAAQSTAEGYAVSAM